MESNQHRIGVLGLGSRVTKLYMNLLNNQYNELHKGYSTCPFIIYNVDFNEINPFLPNDFRKLEPIVLSHFQQIESLGIDSLVIPNITLHETVDRINSTVSILHPIRLSIQKLQEEKEVIVFASKHSMEANYLKESFLKEGIRLLEPNDTDKNFIDHIRTLIYNYKETEKEIEQYKALLQSYVSKHPVLIACTELSIFSPKNQSNVFDMAHIHVTEALKNIKH